MVLSNYVSNSNTLKFDDVVGVILSEEIRRKDTSDTLGNSLIVENRGKQRERGNTPGNCGKSNKGISKSRGKLEC